MSPSKRTMPPRGQDGRFRASEKAPTDSAKSKTTTTQPSRSPTPDLSDLLGPEEDTPATHSPASLLSFPPSAFVSPHISTAPLTPISLSAPPGSPRAPSPAPQSPSPPRNSPMATRTLNLAQAGDTFGGWPDQDPEAFIQSVERQMIISGITTAQGKAHYLKLCLEVKSPASKWFQTLDQAVKADWDQLEPAFTQKWATHQPPQRTNLQKTEDLLNHRLKEEEVGETVPFLGTNEYTHIVWADQVQAMVQDLGIEAGFTYVHQVLNNLPSAVKDNIEGPVTDWNTFIAEVKAVSIEKLTARAKTEKEKTKAERERADRERAMKSEMEELRAQVQKLMIAATAQQTGQGQQATRPPLANTSTSTTAAGKSRQTRAPATEAEKAAVQQKLKTYPHQPDTDAGRAAYRRQVAQWTANRSVGDAVTEATPVPLRPGTAAICSSECFKCGTHGHRAARCVLDDSHPSRLSKEEARWRAICGSTLGPINKATTTEVHLVFNGQGGMRQEWGTGEQELDQGKEEGSPA
jgi:hypothetical protein